MVTRNPYDPNRTVDENIRNRPSPSHRRSKQQEKGLAHSLRGALTPRSGAGDIKGDVRVRRVARIEAKTTKNKSFPVTLELVRKLEENIAAAEVPVLVVEFNDNGKPRGALAVIPLYLLEEFCETKR